MTWEFFPEITSPHMDEDFMRRLIGLRRDFARAMVVTSSYRPLNHPDEIDKDYPGTHTLGRAVDVAIYGGPALRLFALAVVHGFTGVGVHQSGAHARRFLHLDDLDATDHRPRPYLWGYEA